ncbi:MULTISPECIES: DUF2911 domain-containing protein [Aestuariibaculum]|uniref:DUF2911 domain-containing protein n=1 Tax=Aestuariibaculum lutulentum TaxID=2920935 RepID=A0ABS9RL92_9FLAO|nr:MULTISPECIES: DUF2911 domain-containing protein [Aestuariibaculum]MCH4553718.1 DUF2911 domain-containing protein [Aestuariibaculum lutulentum]MCR8668414.1 DUF2911 domain-containing protein [Aestuariibaculum sp. M13]
MKKSTLLTTLAFAFVMLFSLNASAQKFAKLDKSPLDIAYYRTDRNAPPMAKVIYSRPQLNGRALATLAPNGKVWRTGANEAAEIKFYKDSKLGGKDVKAGTYSLYTIPGDSEWTIILSSDTDVWGAYNYKEANDVLRVKAPVSKGESVEAFSIAFDNDNMFLAWDTTRVAVPISQ